MMKKKNHLKKSIYFLDLTSMRSFAASHLAKNFEYMYMYVHVSSQKHIGCEAFQFGVSYSHHTQTYYVSTLPRHGTYLHYT